MRTARVFEKRFRVSATSRREDVIRARNLLMGACVIGVALVSCSASGAVIQWVSDGSGLWSDATNWSSNPNLPGPADDVLIDRPGVEITVTHASGETKVRSLVSNEALVLSGGSLYSVGGSQINNAFTASGGKLVVNPTNDQLVATGDININPPSAIWFQARAKMYSFKAGTYTPLRTSGSIHGVFALLPYPPLGNGLGRYVAETTNGLSYSDSALSLTILKDLWSGDANMDTKCDVPDLNIWNKWKFKYDTDLYGADFNANDKTDVSDFNIWMTSRSWVPPAPLGSQAVPEPGTLAMLVIGAITMLLACRFRRFA